MATLHSGPESHAPQSLRWASRLMGRKGRQLIDAHFAAPDVFRAGPGLKPRQESADMDHGKLRVLVLGFSDRAAQIIADMLRTAQVGTCAISHRIDQLMDQAVRAGHFTHVLVNLEAFADLDDAVAQMLDFRASPGQSAPAIILISADVGADDLDGDRRAICDATLRWPVSAARLQEGLAAAQANRRLLSAQ